MSWDRSTPGESFCPGIERAGESFCPGKVRLHGSPSVLGLNDSRGAFLP